MHSDQGCSLWKHAQISYSNAVIRWQIDRVTEWHSGTMTEWQSDTVSSMIAIDTVTVSSPTPSDCLDQGLSKHQEVSSTPVTKVKKIIVVFWDLLGAIKW